MNWIDRHWPVLSGQDAFCTTMEDIKINLLDSWLEARLKEHKLTMTVAKSLADFMVDVPDLRLRDLRIMCCLIDKHPEAALVIYEGFGRPKLDEYLQRDLEVAWPGTLDRLNGVLR